MQLSIEVRTYRKILPYTNREKVNMYFMIAQNFFEVFCIFYVPVRLACENVMLIFFYYYETVYCVKYTILLLHKQVIFITYARILCYYQTHDVKFNIKHVSYSLNLLIGRKNTTKSLGCTDIESLFDAK